MAKEESTILEKEYLRILVHTTSLYDDIAAMAYFASLSKYKQFQIYYLPVDGCDEINGEQPGRYKHIRDKRIIYSTIQFSDCSGCIGTHHEINGVVFEELTSSDLDRMAERIIVSGNTYAAPFDLVVVSDEWASKNGTTRNKVFAFTDLRETLRIYMIHTKQFYVSHWEQIDEFFYYVYRHKAMFRKFQPFWSSAVRSGSTDSYDDALDNRLLQFSLCIDNIKATLLKEQNNITAMQLKYHLPYLTLVTTGTFDNLAWIIHNKYGLQLHRMKIDLKKSEYIDAVKVHSSALAAFLSDKDVQAQIDAIREIRDRIVHRDFIQTIGAESRRTTENYLFVDAIVKEKLVKAGFPSNGLPTITHSFVCVDIKVFVEFVESIIVEIVNAILGIISKEIYGTEDDICVWQLLRFSQAPLVI